MSPGGTDAGLLELLVGFFAAASIIAVITMIRRRRGGRQDLLGTQMREMEARAAAADTRPHEAPTQVADTHIHEAVPPAPAPADPLISTPDATAAPVEVPSAPDGQIDAMADAFAWLRIAALVETGQRRQAIELLSTTMTISPDEAEMLVDGLNG